MSDLIGKVFGLWTVIAEAGRNKNGALLLVCKCSCSKETIIRLSILNTGRTSKCRDCYNKQISLKNDLTGKQFNKWTVIERLPSKNNKKYYLCRCVCGNERALVGSRLVIGRSSACKSCNQKTHGMSHTSTYKTWLGMIQRCSNPKNIKYSYYGGRGIKVCDRWLIFENFLEDMGLRPVTLSLDRINNDGNYEPGNCRWTTISVQRMNQRPRSKKGV